MDNVSGVVGGDRVAVLNISDVINQLAVLMADVSLTLARSIHEEAGRLSSGTVALMPEAEVNAVRGRLMDRLGTLRAISDMFDLMDDGERRSLLDRMAVSQALYAGHDGLVDSAYELLARHIVNGSPADVEADQVEVQAQAGAGGAGGSRVADVLGLAMPEDDDDSTVLDGLVLVAGLPPVWSGSMLNRLTYGL